MKVWFNLFKSKFLKDPKLNYLHGRRKLDPWAQRWWSFFWCYHYVMTVESYLKTGTVLDASIETKKKAKRCYICPSTPIIALLLELLTVTDNLLVGLSPLECFILHQTYMVHYFPWDFEGLLVILSLTFLKWTFLMATLAYGNFSLQCFAFFTVRYHKEHNKWRRQTNMILILGC